MCARPAPKGVRLASVPIAEFTAPCSTVCWCICFIRAYAQVDEVAQGPSMRDHPCLTSTITLVMVSTANDNLILGVYVLA